MDQPSFLAPSFDSSKRHSVEQLASSSVSLARRLPEQILCAKKIVIVEIFVPKRQNP